MAQESTGEILEKGVKTGYRKGGCGVRKKCSEG